MNHTRPTPWAWLYNVHKISGQEAAQGSVPRPAQGPQGWWKMPRFAQRRWTPQKLAVLLCHGNMPCKINPPHFMISCYVQSYHIFLYINIIAYNIILFYRFLFSIRFHQVAMTLRATWNTSPMPKARRVQESASFSRNPCRSLPHRLDSSGADKEQCRSREVATLPWCPMPGAWQHGECELKSAKSAPSHGPHQVPHGVRDGWHLHTLEDINKLQISLSIGDSWRLSPSPEIPNPLTQSHRHIAGMLMCVKQSLTCLAPVVFGGFCPGHQGLQWGHVLHQGRNTQG